MNDRIMNEETREIITKYVESYNKKHEGERKIVHVDKTCWNNVCTRSKGWVYDLYFVGYSGSGYIKIITAFRIDGKWYEINGELQHRNIGGRYEDEYILDVPVKCQDFCSPITPNHILKNPKIEKVLKGQLMGQNGDSPMRDVDSVCNHEFDYAVYTRKGQLLRSKANPINLITQRIYNDISDYNLNEYDLPKNENEVMVKFKYKSYYSLRKIDDYNVNEISSYYPIITYEDIKKIVGEIPKKEIDMTVIGLGSAGTGILDQIGRSTYFNKYFLIDFDKVEEKNLRNQWYSRSFTREFKVEASKYTLLSNTSRDINCDVTKTKYEKVDFTRLKSKYVVSGFDNLECRLGLLDKVTSGEFECDYLIDLRYLDYTCSIYFIDLKDEKQVKYYRNLLEADIKEFNEVEKENYVQTKEQLKEFWIANNYHSCGCHSAFAKFFKDEIWCEYQNRSHNDCGHCNEGCMNYLWSLFKQHQPKIPLKQEESSCVKENFIDIYKYASSFVFAAIREIEGDEPKPFTHIEAQTTVIPTSVVIRK